MLGGLGPEWAQDARGTAIGEESYEGTILPIAASDLSRTDFAGSEIHGPQVAVERGPGA